MRCEDRCSFMKIDEGILCKFHNKTLTQLGNNEIIRCKECERFELYNRLKRELESLNNDYCEFVTKMDEKFDQVFRLVEQMELDL